MLEAVFRHGKVAGAVAENKNRGFPDLIHDGKNLVGLLVFGDQISFHQDFVIRRKRITSSGCISLAGRCQREGAADHSFRRDPFIEGSGHQLSDHGSLGPGADEYFEAPAGEVFHKSGHWFEISLPIGHIFKAPCGNRHKSPHIGPVFLHSHAREAFRRHLCRRPRGFRFFCPVFQGCPELLCILLYIRRCLESLIIQNSVKEEAVVKIGGESFSEQCPVKVKHGDPVLFRQISVRSLLCHGRYQGKDLLHGGRVFRPEGDYFRGFCNF